MKELNSITSTGSKRKTTLIYSWQTPFQINEIKMSIRKLQKLAMNCFAIVWTEYLIGFLKDLSGEIEWHVASVDET